MRQRKVFSRIVVLRRCSRIWEFFQKLILAGHNAPLSDREDSRGMLEFGCEGHKAGSVVSFRGDNYGY